jgi:hypothetical protein
MQMLTSSLRRMFKPASTRSKADPAYAAFRAYCRGRGLTYKVARDGFIEFSDGVCFGHYGDWAETLSRHMSEAK